MVILQFNKLIRNKWVWGVFAVAVSAAFCFDDLFTTREREERQIGEAGKLAGKAVKSSVFGEIAEDVRGFGHNRDWRRKSWEVNRQAWEIYAMLDIAAANGLTATDGEVAEAIRHERSFQGANGAFSFEVYQRVLAENSLSPERFEQFLKRRLTMVKLGESVIAGTASWASPMELDQAVNDMTDVYTVQVARFEQDAKKAAAVKLDDAGLKRWYDEHVKELALPERMKLRLLKFDAAKPELLAKMTVSEDEMRDRYDVTTDRYTSTDTNGVETVKKFEEVKGEIEQELRQIAAVQCLETNLNRRAYGVAAAGASRLDEIAKEEKLQVVTSDWFALDGSFKPGFTKSGSQICPGAENFLEAVAELDPESEDLRYGIVIAPKAVWLVERAELSPAHEPTFEEAKDVIRPRALEAAKADAFKAEVEAIVAKGAAEVLKGKNVSTNMTFSICDLKSGAFADQTAIIRAASKLDKGQVSGFNQTGLGKALVVVCNDRQPGDAAKAMIFRSQVRADVEMLQRRQLPEAWQKWNLEALGFEPGEGASVTETEDEE